MSDNIEAPPDNEGPNPPPEPVPGSGAAERARPAGGADEADPAPGLDEVLRDVGTTLGRVAERLNEALASIQRVEQRQRIDLAVRLARANDPAAAADAVETVMRQRGVQDLAEALAEVRRTRPGLFRVSAAVNPLALEQGVGINAAPPRAGAGDRRTLLEYMRTRRL